MDFDSVAALIFYTERDLPCYPTIVPNAGLTSPITLAGTLAQGNAEFLAAAVLEQMVRRGKPTIYATLPTVGDMRTGAYAPGAIETGILFIAFAQMAMYYNVPNGGYIGLTNAKVNDAQSGYETGMSAVAGLLGGVQMFNITGLLDSLMAFDFAKAVIDDEIALMLKRIQRGLEFSEANMALDLIAKVGPGGMFMDHPHTLERMKTAAYLPDVADREGRQQWIEKGRLDSQAHAMLRARDLLTQDNPAVFSPEVDARVHAAFPGLVRGDSVPPAGWTRPAPVTGRRERGERRRRVAEGEA
jgi:trimethylamine---corrinoid protein Co-methyltransferase